MKKTFYILLLLSVTTFGQTNNPEQILNKVKEKFDKIEDYVVDVEIKVDVDFLKVPDTKAKIYYKKPDKIHFESENFALLPRNGVDFSPGALLKGKYTAVFEKEEEINGKKTAVIKVIPLEEKSDVVLTTLWIDRSRDIILKAKSTAKIGGTFTLDLKYNSNTGTPLPDSMIFTFDVDKSTFSRHRRMEIDPDEKEGNEEGETKTGKVYINYSHYKINEGIPDSVFEKK